jgi:hypothetical protein
MGRRFLPTPPPDLQAGHGFAERGLVDPELPWSEMKPG